MTGGGVQLGSRKSRKRLPIKKSVSLDALRAEINVTPLVDVCLVLLIIFMVVTPLMARGKEVALPETVHHQTESDKMQPIVAVDLKGRLYFDTEPMEDMKALQRRVENAWRETGGDMRVFVKADTELPFSKVRPLIMAVHELGVAGVDLGTHELRGGSQE